MSTIRVTQSHTLDVEGAKAALASFEEKLAQYKVKLVWSGARGELKGTGVSGGVHVTNDLVTVTVKLGMLAKAAGVKPDLLEQSIRKRLQAAFVPAS